MESYLITIRYLIMTHSLFAVDISMYKVIILYLFRKSNFLGLKLRSNYF